MIVFLWERKTIMQNQKNSDLRIQMKRAGLTFRMLANILQVAEITVYRMLGSDLPEEDRDALKKIIEEYQSGNGLKTNEGEGERNE